MRTLYKILWKDQSRNHLLWAFLGTVAGFVLLLGGIQFYLNIKNVLQENRDLLDPEYIVINKKVDIGQTLGLTTAGFTVEEIDEIRKQPFAREVAPFISNMFPVSAYTENERFPDFYTELFFEAVPDDYIDVKSEQWKWNREEGIIPVIIPQDYLNLYNFGFAQSQGLPRIPKEIISMVNVKIRLRGRAKFDDFPGKIIGFSNRINSILVPYDFLSWANKEYGYFENKGPSRIILVSNDPTNPEIVRFIEEKGYDTIREKLKSSRMNIILKFIVSFLVLLAAIIIGLAFLVFLLSLQLMISRSAEKIRRLSKLGYHYLEISRPYLLILFLLLLGVTLISMVLTGILTAKFSGLAAEWSLDIPEKIDGIIYITSFGLMLLIFLANMAGIFISTRRLCKG
ncbi:MAG: hypothetical protein JXR52_07865 [Bacteroidales bacterium]|nr:hypothetical protein [Bacteroidales bacterium]